MKFKKLLLPSMLLLMSSTSPLLSMSLPGIRLHNGLPDGNYLQVEQKDGPYPVIVEKSMAKTTKGAFSLALQDGVKATLLINGAPSSADYVEFKSLSDKWPNGVQKISIESHGRLAAECDQMTNCVVHFVGQTQ